jgi:hypothetical protein
MHGVTIKKLQILIISETVENVLLYNEYLKKAGTYNVRPF